VQNNYTTIISNKTLYEIINNYITLNKTTIINEDILVEVLQQFFKNNYNIFIDEKLILNIINQYVEEHKTTIIDIDIVRQVVNNYIKANINVIFDVDIINQIITNYREEFNVIIKDVVNNYTGIISDVIVDGDCCFVSLNNKEVIKLTVYDAYANIRDRVQSIVVVPNANGHITHYSSSDFVNLTYLVTPASMANVIAKEASVSVKGLDAQGQVSNFNELEISTSAAMPGRLEVRVLWLKNTKPKSIALYVKDTKIGGTDYMTTFTPIDWMGN
jgi:hypothetical protein